MIGRKAVVAGFAIIASASPVLAEDSIFPDLFGGSSEKVERTPAATPKVQRPALFKKTPPKLPPAIANRLNPNRREGKEGSEEAKVDAEEAREIYLRRKRRLEQIQAQQQELTRDKQMLASNRARMQARLVDTARALRHSEKRLGEIEEKLSVTRSKANEQRAQLEEKSAQMSVLFGLMQGMSRQPPPMMITHSKDALRMIRSGMVLATFYTDIEKLAIKVSSDLDSLEKTLREAERQEQLRKSEQAQSSFLRNQITKLLNENHEQLETAQASLSGLQDVAKIHAASLKSLEDIVPKLDEEVGKQSGLGSYEAELKQLSPDMQVPGSKIALAQPGMMKPFLPFAKAQGLLPLPVQGRVNIGFGQPDRDGIASKGMHIEGRPGAQVMSPCDGWVIFAGPFRSYGQLLIINPGGGYHVVLGGMERTQAAVGQFVLAGEPVAVMRPAETQTADTPAARPLLYVEFRKDKQSIDPSPWWSAGLGKG